MDKNTKLELGKLVLDYTIYPRHEVDSYNVRSMADALNAGTVLPPIIADAKTLRVVDGFHRVAAYRKAGYKPDDKVPVILRDYDDDAALFVAAVEANGVHGKKLTPYDYSIVKVKAEQFGCSLEAVAGACSLTPRRFAQLTAYRGVERPAATTSEPPAPYKRSISWKAKAGDVLTKEQQVVNEHLAGWSVAFHAKQLCMMLEHDLIDPENETDWAELRKLHGLLSSRL